jgi:hypothetical protein
MTTNLKASTSSGVRLQSYSERTIGSTYFWDNVDRKALTDCSVRTAPVVNSTYPFFTLIIRPRRD